MTRARASRWWQSSSVTLFAAAAVSVRFRVAGCVAPRAGAGRGGGPPSRPQHWPGPQDAARRGAPWATSETRRLGLRCPELPPSIDRASGRTPVRHVRVWGLGVRAGRTPRPAQWGARPLSGLRLLCVVGGGARASSAMRREADPCFWGALSVGGVSTVRAGPQRSRPGLWRRRFSSRRLSRAVSSRGACAFPLRLWEFLPRGRSVAGSCRRGTHRAQGVLHRATRDVPVSRPRCGSVQTRGAQPGTHPCSAQRSPSRSRPGRPACPLLVATQESAPVSAGGAGRPLSRHLQASRAARRPRSGLRAREAGSTCGWRSCPERGHQRPVPP